MSVTPAIYFFIALSLFFALLKFLGYDVEYKVLFGMFKTKNGIDIIDKLSKLKIIKYFDKISYYSGFILILISVILVVYGIVKLKPMFAPLIPGTEVHGIYIPLLPTIIAIFFAAFFHELFHGILVRFHNISLRSWGFFFLGPFLGAFVEPDDEEIKKASPKKQISIYNAGPLANIILAFFGFLLVASLTPIFSNTFEYTNVTITKIEPGSPADISGVNPGTILLAIDNHTIKTISDVYEVLQQKNPRDKILLITNESNYTVTLGDKEGRPYIGVFLKQNYIIKDSLLFNLLSFILNILNWIVLVNIGIAIANMLPIYPLDGGRSLYTLLYARLGNKADKYIIVISLGVLLMLIANILMGYI
ncbi:MAG TPA: PDZ domain-containing protein [Candidatus Nanopusillus sp.]|nr:PDZ domain-containing protein [Candidatus Nanopusillus sp.]